MEWVFHELVSKCDAHIKAKRYTAQKPAQTSGAVWERFTDEEIKFIRHAFKKYNLL